MSPVTALLAATAVPPALSLSWAPARQHQHARHYSVGLPSLPGGRRTAVLLAKECSSQPQKKGTQHHMKTRPKKAQPWDIKRRPHAVPAAAAAPAGLDGCCIRRHGTCDPRPQGGRGRRRLWHVTKRLKLFPYTLRCFLFQIIIMAALIL
jgi:50S ribosomal protein 6